MVVGGGDWIFEFKVPFVFCRCFWLFNLFFVGVFLFTTLAHAVVFCPQQNSLYEAFFEAYVVGILPPMPLC